MPADAGQQQATDAAVRRRPYVLLLAAVATIGCVWIVARSSIVTDITAFLPGPATAQQRLLAEQLRDGVAARIVLAGIEAQRAEDEAAAADVSRRFAAALRKDARFTFVANGEASAFERERDLLFGARYLLSPQVTPAAFTEAGLRAAFQRLEAMLSSSLAPAIRPMAANDPTGEMLAVLQRLSQRPPPATRHGVWFEPATDAARRTAILLAQTAAPGFDVDAQEQAADALRAAFESARAGTQATLGLHLTGPGMFAVESRARIEQDAERLSIAATLIVCALLLYATRSPRFVLLSLLPVTTGALAGLAAIAAGFGAIHGLTLGFGLTLIGEAVDYAIYVHAQRPATSEASERERLWRSLSRSLWLAVLTSAAGFIAMIASGFRGLAQLGIFSLVGIVVAGATARWLLPALLPRSAQVVLPGLDAVAGWGVGEPDAPRRRRGQAAWQAIVVAVSIAAGAFLYVRGERVWNDELSALSPLAAASGELDARLRSALAAPELRWLIAIDRPTPDAALSAAEALRPALDRLREAGVLAAFDSPADLVPSAATQAARRAALPAEDELRTRIQAVLAPGGALGNFSPAAFEPFVRDVAAARQSSDVTAASWAGTALGQRLAAQVVAHGGGTAVLVTLSGVDETQADRLRRELEAPDAAPTGAVLIDLKGDVERLIADYRRHAAWAAAGGGVLIVLILALRIRDAASIARIVAVLVTSVVTTAALLVLIAGALTLFNLVALLLVVGVGSNYAIFLTRLPRDRAQRAATIGSVLLAGTASLIAFALLSLSATPVLHMIGLTVAVGAIVSLLCAAAFARFAAGN